MDDARVQQGLQKALSDSSKGQRSQKDAELASTDSDASSRSGSPDQCCSICLGKFRDKSFSDGCFHRFCFHCIREWAKVKSTCPLCKTPFKSIIHNVVSSDVYDQYVLQPTENGSFDLDRNGARFRYHTTLTNNRRSAWETRMDQLFNRQARLAERIRRDNEARQRRQLIYAAGLRVHHIAANRFTRFREASPHFFRENPAMVHRLIPWLRRDLSVLFNGNENYVSFMTQYVESLLPRVDIQSEDFHNNLRPFLFGRTEHFIHELSSFARSPHDLETYDQMAQYDFRPENPQFTATLRPQMPLIAQDNSSSESENDQSNNNNDVIVISSGEDNGQDEDDSFIDPILASLKSSHTWSVQNKTNHGNIPGPSSAADVAGPSSTLDVAGPSSTSDVAGPSTRYSLSETHNPEPPNVDYNQPGPSGVTHPSVEIKREAENSLTKENSGENDDGSDSSDSSIVFLGYVKSWKERTPIAFITISDDSLDEAKENEASGSKGKLSRHKSGKSKTLKSNDEKPGGKRKQKTKHTRSSHSASRGGTWSTDSEDSHYHYAHHRHDRRSRDREYKEGHYSHSRGRRTTKSPRAPTELYRKFREEKNKWSMYYESRHGYETSSRSTSSHSRHRRSRSRSRSRSKSQYYDRYDDYQRVTSRYSRDDYYSRSRYSRSRSRSKDRSRGLSQELLSGRPRSREASRDRLIPRLGQESRSISRSRSCSKTKSFDRFSDDERHSSKISYRYGSTSSTVSRHSRCDSKAQRKDTSPTRHQESMLKSGNKRKRTSDEDDQKEDEKEKDKDGGSVHSKKKHKHKHKHHKHKSSRHKHKSKGKDKEGRHKSGDKHTKGVKKSKDRENLSSTSNSESKKKGKTKHSRKLKTYIDPNESHITLQELLNMDGSNKSEEESKGE